MYTGIDEILSVVHFDETILLGGANCEPDRNRISHFHVRMGCLHRWSDHGGNKFARITRDCL